jgi:hypothetical protein
LRSDPAFVALLRELRGKWEGSREAATRRVAVVDTTGLWLRDAVQPIRGAGSRHRGATALLAHEAGEPAETLELPSGGGSSNIPVVARGGEGPRSRAESHPAVVTPSCQPNTRCRGRRAYMNPGILLKSFGGLAPELFR